MQASRTHAPTPPGPALLPFLRAAHNHVGQSLRAAGIDRVATARAAVSYDLAMLALGHHARLSPHAAAMTVSQLLFLAAELSRRGAGPAREPVKCDAMIDCGGLERDAAMMADQTHLLTQEDVAAILGRFCDALDAQGLHIVQALKLELAEAEARTQHYAAEAIPPAFMLPRGPASVHPRA